MNALDWAVLAGTLALIVGYGVWKTRGGTTVETYLRGAKDTRWWTVGLSIMATQASAITFLSMPGQAHEDGMGFVQFYFGLPIAMVLLSALVVPIYFRLKVYTAYEYLERRFDLKTRQLTGFLFLISRGLAAGISIYAPAIILSTVLGWRVDLTNVAIGTLVILYTVSGGTRAVNQTQTWQMTVMLGGMALAFIFILYRLPGNVSFGEAVGVAGTMGRMNAVDFSLRLDTRYTFWSGLTGGLFVQLAYFGTDQSQVQRYLSGGSLTEARLGLLMNGLVKIPMQFLILFVGLMVFVFHQFQAPPVYFNNAELRAAEARPEGAKLGALESDYSAAWAEKRRAVDEWLAARRAGDEGRMAAGREHVRTAAARTDSIRKEVKSLVAKAQPRAATNDADYIFITFVLRHFPAGLIGLLIAVIFCAAMSASASALNALGSTSVVDFYRRSIRKEASDAHYLAAARWFTVLWGVVAILFAAFASLVDNLIQAVNILGSIFYGPMLGVFIVGFFLKHVRGTPVFVATLVAQAIVVATWLGTGIGFLWYNVIGCAAVVAFALALDLVVPRRHHH